VRAFLLVIDSFGIGALPDAADYGDSGSNTAVHIGQAVGGVHWPNLTKMGLGNAAAVLSEILPGAPPQDSPLASYGVMREVSPGKDTTTGHWELAGIQLEKPFPVFPPHFPSFPEELLSRIKNETGFEFLGNKAASGTDIIEELGAQHLATGKPIAYTSGDSVFQIAAHEDVLSLERLYDLCHKARRICDDWTVGRVIARPFRGRPGAFERTSGRHDYSFRLPGPSILDHLRDAGVETVGVGKIGDIFDHQGLDKNFPDKGNPACLDRCLTLMQERSERPCFVFVNLVDTDMNFGHRRDPQGYHDSVAATDAVLGQMMGRLDQNDLLLISADHGCDPTFKGTDHTREHVPLLSYRPASAVRDLGIRSSFADVAQSLATFFLAPPYPKNGPSRGKNFLH